jgi:hypothetical protein
MPAIFKNTSHLAQLRQLALKGDIFAESLMALMDNTYFVSMTAGAEAGGGAAANSIRITVQVKDQDGQAVAGVRDLHITSVPNAGVGTITIGAAGTLKSASAQKTAWIQTNSSGVASFDVLNASVEDNLVVVTLDNGTVETLKITFA